jgi:hypothetical protein
MKAIIYAGISLFSVATVYGVVDYYNSNKTGKIDTLYEEKEVSEIPVSVQEQSNVVIPVKNIETLAVKQKIETEKTKPQKKINKSTKKINFSDFSRARIPIREIRIDSSFEAPKKGAVEEKKENPEN